MTANAQLTDNEARKAISPQYGQRILWDAAVKGFGLRITANSAKAFVLDYRIDGRQRRITIGSFPDWTVAAARKFASEMKQDVDRGIDPMAERQARRDAPTVCDLWERYQKEFLPHKAAKTRQDEISMWKTLLLPKLGKCKVFNVEPADIDALHQEITTVREAPVRANRAVASLRKAFNLAIRWNWLDKNPVIGVRRNPEEKRGRYLDKKEIAALVLALNEHPEATSANAIKLLMLTGARKGEVLGATWDMFDLENSLWTKPSAHTKQRKLHRVPLNKTALQLLNDIKEKSDADFQEASKKDKTATISPYVFPGPTGEPLQEVRRTWLAVCKAAGLTDKIERKNRQGKVIKDEKGNPVLDDWPNVRIHDLRHSFASILVSSGASLPLIGQMLGHTQVQTTQRYAHLYDDPLRKAAEAVDNFIMLPVEPAKIENKGKKKNAAQKR